MIDEFEIRKIINNRLAIFDRHVDTPDLSDIMKTVDKIVMEQVLIYTRGNQTRACKILGIHRGTLGRKYRKSFNTSS